MLSVDERSIRSPSRDEDPLAVCVGSYRFDSAVRDPEELLARYHAMTGWAKSLVGAGAGSVKVVQRFSRAALVLDGAVEYHFVPDDEPGATAPWFRASHLADCIRGFDPDAVHVDGFLFPMALRQLRRKLRPDTAILVQDHGGFNRDSRCFRKRVGRLLYRFGLGVVDGFLFTAREQAAPWLDAGIIRDERLVHEIPESSTDMPSWVRPPGNGCSLPGCPALLWVGRLDANKDPLTVLDGFAIAAESLPEAELTLVYGDDVLLPEVEARIAQSTVLRNRVHLLGPLEREQLPSLYASADLFVLASHHEVACFSLIEALSFGVAPVVTDIPPFRNMTAGGRIGALFPPGNSAEFARAVVKIARTARTERGSIVSQHFGRELSWAAVGRRALRIYQDAVSTRRSPRRPTAIESEAVISGGNPKREKG